MRSVLIPILVSILALPALAGDEDLAYDVELFPGTSYDASIPTPESLLGFRPGDRAAFPAEIERCLEAWDEASPRTKLVEYARSHEGRALYYMIVTSPENLARIDEIQQAASSLADPRELSASAGEELLDGQPAIAWMAYSIHGDETSGTDASLAVLHHLVAGTSPEVTELLETVVVLVDPMQNPDGRHRFLQQIAEHRAKTPNVDDQSLLHAGYWPWGRTNHYNFDLNRDWTLAVNPESRGRVEAAGDWHPQLMVDAHEMGPQDTYLFSPARAPRSPFLPGKLDPWGAEFARDQSKAFDRHGWVYYTGEWNEGWYPGYTDAWGGLRGAVPILYEQAGFAEDGVRQAPGNVVTYREAVHHQAVSSIANLTTLSTHRKQILADYLAERRSAVSADGRWADRAFAVLPSANRSRLHAFLELMELQNIEVYQTPAETRVAAAVDQMGRRQERASLPAGTYWIPNRQPEAHLVAAMLEFDPRMPRGYLERERKSILRTGQSTIYDATAWNQTMLYGLPALTVEGGLPAGAKRWQPTSRLIEAPPSEAVAWFVDGADDASVALAARLLESGVRVRVSDKAVSLGGADFVRGSVVVVPADNRGFEGDLGAAVAAAATPLDLEVKAVTTGLGEEELPDIGGGHFQLLQAPRIALLSRDAVSPYDFGSIWHTLDHQVGIRHSHLESGRLQRADLRRYNLLVLPDSRGRMLTEGEWTTLRTWVEAGGTLIAIARSAARVATEASGLSDVRALRDVLGQLDDYETAVLREEMARVSALPGEGETWSHVATAEGSNPWQGLAELERPSKEELDRRDAWDRMFMPAGAFIAARVDAEHWLTYGVGDELPVLAGGGRVLMAKHPVATPVRLGVLEPREDAEARRVGWSTVPAGHDLRLRMSGLLWPEAAGRMASSAAVTREGVGHGQVILFANSPTFRASTRGTARLLLNAIVYGPGLGADAPILP
ncbi:MAG: peptidase [bacterium]|nr:peptidase [bacterium]